MARSKKRQPTKREELMASVHIERVPGTTKFFRIKRVRDGDPHMYIQTDEGGEFSTTPTNPYTGRPINPNSDYYTYPNSGNKYPLEQKEKEKLRNVAYPDTGFFSPKSSTSNKMRFQKALEILRKQYFYGNYK